MSLTQDLGGFDRLQRSVVAEMLPMPRSKLPARLAFGGVTIAAFGGVFLYSASDALWPAHRVQVAAVIAKTGIAMTAGSTIQAPGWTESDPYGFAASALTDGVVKEVLVLEGEPVSAGQVVVRMVDDDARLALARAVAEVAQREAELAATQAGLTAAQREWENPVDRVRAVDTAEAIVAQTAAELGRLDAEIAAEQAKDIELRAEFERVVQVHANQSASRIELVRAEQQSIAQAAKL